MLSAWHIWIIIALVCFIIEIFTTGFAISCLSIGALPAAIASAFDCPLVWQIIIFAVFTFLAFMYVRPFVVKAFFKPGDGQNTNANALIGRKGRVSTEIDPEKGTGRVAIDGDDWKAVSVDGNHIPKGTQVEIVKVDSVIVTVRTI